MSAQDSKPLVRGRRPAGAVSGRDALLPVATRYFSRNGYDGTSLRKIAAEAGVDMALVARLFGSKSDLWNAVLEHLLDKQRHHLEEISAIEHSFSINPAEGFRRFIRHLTAISVEIPEFPSLLLNEAARGDERLEYLLLHLVTPFRDSCLPVIRLAMENGIIRSHHPSLTFALIISAISLPLITPGLIAPDAPQSTSLSSDIADEAIRLFVVSEHS
ncbi:MAG: TetR/AcrR family transcriptional regulator [Erwinia billingiae]|jgi:AcrR family transcriptional regulator|uniref:TetR/AcrR family transcriptional regulator n=1 Tax=Erwinia billingiae TaxID=182337 RepID=UPI00092D6295|nr:TetR/AcrR family transcriptional regulator [Erwinia billingiae]